MASLNGVSLKNLKTYAGHEGEPCMQGSVYYNGKKLGFWSQDGHGGPDRFDFDERLLEIPFLTWKSALTKSEYYDCLHIESFLAVISSLNNVEKWAKKSIKNGYPYVLYSLSLTDGCCNMMAGKTEKALENKKSEIENEVKKYVSGTDGSYILTKIVLSESPEAFDIKVGSKDKVKEEKWKIEEEKEKRLKEYEEQKRKIEEAEKRRSENKRFVSKRHETEPSVIIKDMETGKTTVVSLYAHQNVLDALIDLFGW